uniref:Transketolase, C-terminal subunit (TktA, tktB) n=1 Tax=uncultured marine group II/III euryarchaeote AD1000_65_C10 TaxID=1457794 RepID=A0A075FVR5_9EURY|nr:Transketolase, C-terminal subunit (tktA, tktB) [uncultured marine group II/III euryarchaeote AD1000_65_C10]MBC8518413.1 transketolase family protein [Euryarchaeota archaeon]
MTLVASRDGYGSALVKLASDPEIIVVEADLGKSTKSQNFRKLHPERTISLGIAEQNMMLVSAGLATSGYKPFASTFAIFTERAFEQIRNGIARPNIPVHICGSHGGIHTGTDGSSAQSIEDLAIYRSLPNMVVLHPSDFNSTEQLTIQLANTNSPSYTRTARNKTPVIYDEEAASKLQIGKGAILVEGGDVAIIACGVMVSKALEAAESLSNSGINATVVDMHTIKPLDGTLISSLAEQCGCFVTAEDHSVIGGLGGAVAEHLVENCPAPLERVGVSDHFGQSGDGDELLEEFSMGMSHIVAAAQRVIQRK